MRHANRQGGSSARAREHLGFAHIVSNLCNQVWRYRETPTGDHLRCLGRGASDQAGRAVQQ
jgi:hypothetical protein